MLDKECHVMAILCRKQVLFLAFPTRESLRQWEATIRTELGEDRQFPVCLVKSPKEARLPLGKVKLCIQGQNLCIVTLGRSPPEVLSSWHVTDLRRFGVIDDKFCFEGGSQCEDRGAGVHVFLTEDGEEINRLLQQASQKRLSRTNSSASTCRRNVRVNKRDVAFRSCSAYLDWSHIYPESDNLYEAHNGLRSLQLEHNDTSSDDTDADYRCEVEEQKLRSIDRWNREQLNTIYSTSSYPDCHSCYSNVGNVSSLTVGGSSIEVAKSSGRNSVSATESAHSGHSRVPVSYAGESKDSRSVASSDSDEVFTTTESDYYNILPPSADYYNILPPGGTCNVLTDSPVSCSNLLGSAPRGKSVQQSKPQSVVLRAVKSVAYRNKRNRIVHRSHTLPRTIHECRTDIYHPDSPGSLYNDTSSSTSNKTPTADDSVDVLSEGFQAYHVSDYEHVRVYDAVSETCAPSNTSSFTNVLEGRVSVKARTFPEDSDPCGDMTMALPGCRANSSMASHAYGAARVCPNSDESPYMNLSVPQNKPRAPCGLQAQEAHSGEVRIDPLRPLEYIDLNRFDGVDETYSCWLRGKSETPPLTLPPPPPPPVHTDAQEQRSSMGGSSNSSPHGTPTRSVSSKVELPKKRLQKANRFLSFHGSLKRQTKSKSNSEKSLPDDAACRRSHSMHSGKLPRCSSFGHTLPRPGSQSVDCVNHASTSTFSVANSSVRDGSETGGLPPRPTRAPSMQSVSEYLTPSVLPSAGNNTYHLPKQSSSSSQQNLNATSSTRSDYMMMDPSTTTAIAVSVTSNTVFCTVDLPLKRTNSVGGRSRNASFSGSNSGCINSSDRAGKGYLEMSDAAKAMGRSMSMRENAGMSQPPPLHHSKSWGDELESNYLQMSCSAAGDYIQMSSTDMERLSHVPQSDIRLLKPFDNLLEHKHHLHRKPIVTPRALPSREVDRMGSDSKPSSDEDGSSSKTGNGKTPGLLSRLIRRNSSKKARSQEDILAATSIETVPEVPQVTTISHVRTKSADMLDDAPSRNTPERQRSMSYSDMSFSRFGLAEQKPRSLLFAVPPAPGAQSDAGLFVSVPPPVPPRATGNSSNSLASGRSDTATYVTVAAASTDGSYFTVGPGMGALSTTSRHVSEGPYNLTCYPRNISTTISESNSVENMTSRNGQPMATGQTVATSQAHVLRASQSMVCPSGQSELPRSGDDSPECDYLMVWADSPGRSSSGDSPATMAVLLPSRTSNLFDRPPAGQRRNSNTSEIYTHVPQEAPGVLVTKTDPIPIPLPQARLNEDEHGCSSASPPALPEKTYRRSSYSRHGYLALPARRRTVNLAEAPPADSPNHSCYSSDAESVCLPATVKTAAEKLKHIPSLRVSIPSLTTPQEEEQDGIWMHRDTAPMQEEPCSSRSTFNGPTSYDAAETMSVMSHGSSDTPSSVRSDELKSCTSPASTTLRPRSGKEYQKLDRRKLAEDLNIPLEELLTPKSPSVSSSVFTFDSAISLRASPASAYSCGEDSPSMLTQRYSRDCINRTDSVRSSETSPPGSCMSLVGNPDISEEALLNYAEIDLSDSEASKRPPCRSGNEIEYAIIDMVATVTASRVGKEHAQLREDKLQQNVQRQDSGKERDFHVTRRVKEKRFSSMNSREKKLSLTSIISSNSKGKKSSL